MEWKKCSLVLRSSKEIWQENERVRHLGEEMWKCEWNRGLFHEKKGLRNDWVLGVPGHTSKRRLKDQGFFTLFRP
jgi:hypothetical protein